MSNAVANCRCRSQRQINNTKLSIQTTGGFLCNQLADTSNFERSFLDRFCDSANVLSAHCLQRMFYHTGSADTYIYDSFRLCNTMESAGHKRIIRHCITENNQFCTANSITVCSTFCCHFDYTAHFRNCIHINPAFSRTDTDRGTDNISYCQSFGNRTNKISITFGITFINQGRKTADKINAYCFACLIKRFSQRNIIIAVAAFTNHRNRSYRNTFINDWNTKLHFQFLADLNKLFSFPGDLIIYLLRRYFYIRMTAVAQTDSHSDRTHIQVVLRDHLVSFQDIFNREHRQPPRYGASP